MATVDSRFIGIIQVIDPDSGGEVEVALRKLETGGIGGLDGAYLQSFAMARTPITLTTTERSSSETARRRRTSLGLVCRIARSHADSL